jgi:DNA transformation protein
VAKQSIPPLRNSRGFTEFVLDQLAGLGDVTPKSMFGGMGLYSGDCFFGIIAGDVLYLKVDDETRPSFERIGSRPFRPYPDRPGTMQYYEVPLAVLEDVHDLLRRARGAVRAAERAQEKKPRTRR